MKMRHTKLNRIAQPLFQRPLKRFMTIGKNRESTLPFSQSPAGKLIKRSDSSCASNSQAIASGAAAYGNWHSTNENPCCLALANRARNGVSVNTVDTLTANFIL